MSASSPTVAYLFTTFPKVSETFLQREVRAMLAQGVDVRLFSLWGGGGTFGGVPVVTFSKWRLLELLGIIPWAAVVHPRVFWRLVAGVLTRRSGSALTLLENFLGAGFAGVHYRGFRRAGVQWIHAVWGGGPATAAWILHRLNGHPYSVGVHAYDLYQDGGDPWLPEKVAAARFVHTSTAMAAAELQRRRLGPGKVLVIRRGLDAFPVQRPLRDRREPLRILCVARLVEKKGLLRQVAVYRYLKEQAFSFTVRVVGEGPLRAALERRIGEDGLRDHVQLLGQLPSDEVWRQLEWADVLVHTGVVAASGDRDGLPNVIPEAMSAGVLVVTTPEDGPQEAVTEGRTGFVAPLDEPARWESAFRRIATDDGLAEAVRREARRWTEENYDARRNAAVLAAAFRSGGRQEP